MSLQVLGFGWVKESLAVVACEPVARTLLEKARMSMTCRETGESQGFQRELSKVRILGFRGLGA